MLFLIKYLLFDIRSTFPDKACPTLTNIGVGSRHRTCERWKNNAFLFERFIQGEMKNKKELIWMNKAHDNYEKSVEERRLIRSVYQRG